MNRNQASENMNQQHGLTTVSTLLLQQLHLWGVERLYGVAGDAILHLLQRLGEERQLDWIPCLDESAAAMMAAAESTLTQRPGVCVGTSGPGLANMLNGIAVAAADHLPLLVITGQVAQAKIGSEAKQSVDQQRLIQPFASFSVEVQEPQALLPLLRTAYVTALTQRGVAHLSIPQNLFAQITTGTPRPLLGLLQQVEMSHLQQQEQFVELLQTCHRPAFLLGVGARQARNEVLQLAERMEAALFESLGAKGVIPAAHPLFVGGIGEAGTEEGMKLFHEADLILNIGCNWWPNNFVPQTGQVLSIDHTPASIETHPAVDYGLIGDAATILQKISGELQERSRLQWGKQIKQCKEGIQRRFEAEIKQGAQQDSILPAQVMEVLSQSVAPDGIITVDTGDHTIWFNRQFQAQNQTVLFSGKWRTMGYALPAAIGAQLSAPKRQVTAVSGDGSFVTTMMELATLQRLELPVTLLILKNHTYGKEESSMRIQGGQPFGVRLQNPDFVQLGTAYGIEGEHVKTPEQLHNALRHAYNKKAPYLIEVETSYVVPPLTQ